MSWCLCHIKLTGWFRKIIKIFSDKLNTRTAVSFLFKKNFIKKKKRQRGNKLPFAFLCFCAIEVISEHQFTQMKFLRGFWIKNRERVQVKFCIILLQCALSSVHFLCTNNQQACKLLGRCKKEIYCYVYADCSPCCCSVSLEV